MRTNKRKWFELSFKRTLCGDLKLKVYFFPRPDTAYGFTLSSRDIMFIYGEYKPPYPFKFFNFF